MSSIKTNPRASLAARRTRYARLLAPRSWPHRDAGGSEVLLRLPHPVVAVVEDRGAEDGIGMALGDRLAQVLELAGATGGDHRHRDRIGHGSSQLEVIAIRRAVAVHAGQQHLPRPAFGCLDRPGNRVAPLDPLAATVDVDAPTPILAFGVDRDRHALGAEVIGELGQQLWPGKSGGVDRDLVGAGVEHGLRILYRPYPAAGREGDEDVVGGAASELDDRLAPFVRCGDVEEDELVGALGVVALGQLDRGARVAQADEGGALDDAPGIDVQAGDYALQNHAESLEPIPVGRGDPGRVSLNFFELGLVAVTRWLAAKKYKTVHPCRECL